MLRRTGPGKTTVDGKYSGKGMLKALLHNFDVDGEQPKPEHVDFLLTKVLPLLQEGRGHIWMQGSASRTGPNQYNLELSRRRVRNVASVLRTRGVLDKQMQLDAVGEEMDAGHIMEEEKDRAVALLVLPVAKDAPPPQPKPPSPPPLTDHFKLRVLGAITVSKGPVQLETMFIQIWDPQHNLTAHYTYEAGGLGRSLFKKVSASGTKPGPWNDFITSAPIRVSEFHGWARFTTGGGGNWTLNYLNMMSLPPGVSTLPRVLSINTGFTVGVGVSTSVGKLIWQPAQELPFRGP